MSQSEVTIRPFLNSPIFIEGDSIPELIAQAREQGKITFDTGDVLCIASKIVSITEGLIVDLATIEPGEVAKQIQKQVPRKDPSLIQLMLDVTKSPDGSALRINGDYIGGRLPNGLLLTSAGIDKMDGKRVAVLPENPDECARKIGVRVTELTSQEVAIIVTDSDGRGDREGATQLAIGTYGMDPIRKTQYMKSNGELANNEETVCDLYAAAAGLLMGQRGNNVPIVVISGVDYDFDSVTGLSNILH